MTDRYQELRKLFQERKLFKLVCGAGNEDLTEVRRLATIYTLAGAAMHDLSANVDVVEAAKKGIKTAYELAPMMDRKIALRPFLNVSIGIKGDPHVRKAQIDKKVCTCCGKCIDVCRQEAIEEDFIIQEFRCIGCGDCEKACAFEAINFIHKKADFDKILPECARAGVETMELHAVTEDDDAAIRDWRLLNRIIKDNFVSVCLDRSLLSNKRIIERIEKMYEITGERMIVQADGVPMSGEGDDFNTTLQAVACADVVMKSGMPVMVLLSGGTNSKTGTLARQCGVFAHGVAVGSFARKIVKPFVMRDDFDADFDIIKEAVSVAEDLVRLNLEDIHG
ncbi:MAG: 4Fe-4S ferredoxin [Proteobacteria bacterium]|nr:4Fe-4S ferredoxin [Pseudomonadota bacterium]